MMAIFFSASALQQWRPAFARMSWELAAGLAAIGLLAAIYHPVGTAMLVALPRVGPEIDISSVWGNLDLVFLPKRSNPLRLPLER
jgi:hypothetical protein